VFTTYSEGKTICSKRTWWESLVKEKLTCGVELEGFELLFATIQFCGPPSSTIYVDEPE
jgi:hypothetical protein